MAWRPRPATWPWLLAHEMRLLWRMSGGVGVIFLLVLGGFLMFAAHLAAWLVMRRFDLEVLMRGHSVLIAFATLFVLLLVLSSAFGLAVSALFSRGDIDLLLSSPVPIRNVYAVRAIAVGFTSVSLVFFFWIPIADMGPIHGHWGTLAGLPVLFCLGLACAAIAFAVTLGLVRLLGLRRANVTAQVIGAISGAFLVLAMQFQNLLPKDMQAAISSWAASERATAWLGPHSVLTWPSRALFGDPLPTVAVLVLTLGVFVLTVRLSAGAFAGAVQEGNAAAAGSRRTSTGPRAFRRGLARIVIAKELTLIARDPMLIAKSLVQLLYFIPLMVILLRHAAVAGMMAASLVVLSGTLAGTFAWLAVSGEEAPDLVGSAPVSAERVRWLKVAAALVPVAVVDLPFLAWYATESLGTFAIVAVFLAATLATSAVIQVWVGVPGNARDLRVRNKQNMLINMVEALSTFGWALGCYLAVAGHPLIALAGVALGLVAPVTAWFAGRARVVP